MKTCTQIFSFVIIALMVMAGNVHALDWTYYDDADNDASGGWKYEVYRMGYAFDDDYLYFNMVTGMKEEGWIDRDPGLVNPGDLYINVGGSRLDASGRVFGLALTGHEGDMNDDMTDTHSTYSSGDLDNGYLWTEVIQGYLYSDAIFSTGIYEDYESTGYWSISSQDDGGDDPFGDANNAPAHIAEFGADLGFQGDVTWDDIGSNRYEVNAAISLDALGVLGGESIELWWSMECGNDFFSIDLSVPDPPAVPEPGTLLLVGLGLLGLVGLARKHHS